MIGLGGGSSAPKVAGARAFGGEVNAGNTYLVGEAGPELFTPSRSGQIIANNRLGGGGVTVAAIIVNGAQNGAEVARQVAEQMQAELQEAFRGAISDTGIA
jgi:phage-related minor tail protein